MESNMEQHSTKHAFLIIAHNRENDLINLIKSVDDVDNDIFIHIDKKWKDCDFNKIKSSASRSQVYMYKQYSVTWGGGDRK